MSEIFTYIATKTTSDPYVPPMARDLITLARDVSDGIYALQGGRLQVGKLAFYSAQRSVAFHLLCDGQEVPKAAFAELYDFIGDFEGVPVDPDNFVLPNFVGTLAPAAAAAAETVEASTVTSETPSSSGTGSGGSEDYAVESGARYRGSGPLP